MIQLYFIILLVSIVVTLALLPWLICCYCYIRGYFLQNKLYLRKDKENYQLYVVRKSRLEKLYFNDHLIAQDDHHIFSSMNPDFFFESDLELIEPCSLLTHQYKEVREFARLALNN